MASRGSSGSPTSSGFSLADRKEARLGQRAELDLHRTVRHRVSGYRRCASTRSSGASGSVQANCSSRPRSRKRRGLPSPACRRMRSPSCNRSSESRIFRPASFTERRRASSTGTSGRCESSLNCCRLLARAGIAESRRRPPYGGREARLSPRRVLTAGARPAPV